MSDPNCNKTEDIWSNVLGVSEDSSIEQIAVAYRKLIITNHPDKFAHLAPDEFKQQCARFLRIGKAYDEAIQHRQRK